MWNSFFLMKMHIMCVFPNMCLLFCFNHQFKWKLIQWNFIKWKRSLNLSFCFCKKNNPPSHKKRKMKKFEFYFSLYENTHCVCFSIFMIFQTQIDKLEINMNHRLFELCVATHYQWWSNGLWHCRNKKGPMF